MRSAAFSPGPHSMSRMPSTIDSSLSTVSGGSRFAFRRGGGGAPRRRMTASEEAEIVSLATKQAVSAAVSIIKAGGTQATALSTATAAAKSVLLPSKHEVPSNKDFLNRKKLKRHVDVIASLALTSALNMAQHSDSSMMMHENVQVDVADMLMSRGRSLGPDHLIYTQTAGGDSYSQLSNSIVGNATHTGSVAPFSHRSRVQTPSVISRAQTPSTQPPINHQPTPSPEPSKRETTTSPESMAREQSSLPTIPILSFLKSRQSAASPEISKVGTVSPETVQETPSLSLPMLNFLRPYSPLKQETSKDEVDEQQHQQQQAQPQSHRKLQQEEDDMAPAHVMATSHSTETPPEKSMERGRSIPRIPSNKSDVSAFIDYFRKKREREIQKKPNAASSVREAEASKIPNQMPMPRSSQASRASGIIKSLDKDHNLENKALNDKNVRSVMSEESSYATESNGGTYNVDEEYTYEESFYSTEDETLDDQNSYVTRPRDVAMEEGGDGKGVLSGFADLLSFALNCGPEPPCTRPPTPVPSKTRNQPQAFKPYRNSSPDHYEQRDDSSDFRGKESESSSSANSSEILRELNCPSEESDIIRTSKRTSGTPKKESVSSLVLRVLSEAVPTSPAHANTQPSYSSPQRPRLLVPPNEQESRVQTNNKEFTNDSQRFQTNTRSSSSRNNYDEVPSQLSNIQQANSKYSAHAADVIIQQQTTSPSERRSQRPEDKSKKKHRFGWGRKSKKMPSSAAPVDF